MSCYMPVPGGRQACDRRAIPSGAEGVGGGSGGQSPTNEPRTSACLQRFPKMTVRVRLSSPHLYEAQVRSPFP